MRRRVGMRRRRLVGARKRRLYSGTSPSTLPLQLTQMIDPLGRAQDELG